MATNIALDRGYAIATNEAHHVFDGFIPEELLLTVEMDQAFPRFSDDIDVVFDLAGSISKSAQSINSALMQSDLILVPIYNEVKAINAGLNTIKEVLPFGNPIAVIATKLQKKPRQKSQPSDFDNISAQVRANFSDKLPILPLKASAAFDEIFERECSIRQLMQDSPLLRFHYRDVAEQFEKIYHLIDQTHAMKK